MTRLSKITTEIEAKVCEMYLSGIQVYRYPHGISNVMGLSSDTVYKILSKNNIKTKSPANKPTRQLQVNIDKHVLEKAKKWISINRMKVSLDKFIENCIEEFFKD